MLRTFELLAYSCLFSSEELLPKTAPSFADHHYEIILIEQTSWKLLGSLLRNRWSLTTSYISCASGTKDNVGDEK